MNMAGTEAADYESGTQISSEEIQDLICEVYGINETWLYTGAGKMFAQKRDNKNLRWFMLWDPSGKYESSQLWLVDKVAGFSDLKVSLLAEIAVAMK